MNDHDWWSMLRALDEPLPPREPLPPVDSFLRPVPGSPGRVHLDEEAIRAAMRERPDLLGSRVGWEVPRDFDHAAIQARFDRLAERLSEAYEVPLVAGAGPAQDAACFGGISIPAEVTKTRTKRSRIRFPLRVIVSNFGGLAAYLAFHDASTPTAPTPPVHPDDRERIEGALTGLGYLVVPEHILAARYDGPNSNPAVEMTWYTRFFGYL